MPNWCLNEVRIDGPAKDMRILSEAFGCHENLFSFNSFMPVPKELENITEGGLLNTDTSSIYYYKNLDDGKRMVPVEKQKELMKKYGACTSYDWKVRNWGCKWDASLCSNVHTEVSENGDWGSIEVTFETPWGPPEGIYEKIVDMFPDVNIDWFYKEPNMRLSGWLGD